MAKIAAQTRKSFRGLKKDIAGFEKRSAKALKKLIDKEVKSALVDVSKTLIKDMRSSLKTQRHTGTLSRSIGRKMLKKSRRTPLSRRVLIGPRLGENWRGYHGHLVEKGTADRRAWKGAGGNRGAMPAFPFMAPAFDRNQSMIAQRIRGVIKRFPLHMRVL